jgi:hypothetical protein
LHLVMRMEWLISASISMGDEGESKFSWENTLVGS